MNIFEEQKTKEFFEVYPHIKKRVKLFWGYAEGRDYLMSLIRDDRTENRRGFPREYFMVISRLLDTHNETFPQFVPKGDIWDL